MFCALVSSSDPAALEAIARAFSPRIERIAQAAGAADLKAGGLSGGVIFDVDGLTRIFGSPEVIGREVQRFTASQGVSGRTAIAGTKTAVWLLAHARPGVSVVPHGAEAAALAELPLEILSQLPESGT